MGETAETAERLRARSALGTRAAQTAGHWHGTALVGQTRTAKRGSERPTGPEPFPPFSAKLGRAVVAIIRAEIEAAECISLGFHFWSIICTIYPLN